MLSPGQRALGLELVENLATQAESDAIIAALPEHSFNGKTGDGRNNIWRYGPQRAYKSKVISKTVPPSIELLSQRLFERGFLDAVPQSITVNSYFQGQTIIPHIDALNCGPIITVLSLLAPATMRFRGEMDSCFDVELPPLSVVFMRGIIRKTWTHEILPLQSERRYSVVFRA